MSHPAEPTPRFVDALYRELLQHSVATFFPDGRLELLGAIEPCAARFTAQEEPEGVVAIEWLGARYALTMRAGRVTSAQYALLASVGRVLTRRYELLAGALSATHGFQLFRGLPEDRYVSTFLEALSTAGAEPVAPDRIADAIDVLRASALGTYENRRITMGVLLFGARPDP